MYLETKHKPFVPLLSKTHLDHIPPQVLQLSLRLMHFDCSITHVPGKLLYTADALSSALIDEVVIDKDDSEAMVYTIFHSSQPAMTV